MAEEAPEKVDQPRKKRRRPLLKGVAWLFVFLAILLSGTMLVLKSGGLTVPAWATAQIEARLNPIMGENTVALSGIDIALADNGEPQLELRDVVLANAFGAPVLRFDKVEAALSPRPLLSGVVQPRAIRVSGGQLRFQRRSDGSFNLSLGGDDPVTASGSVAEILQAVEALFASEVLKGLKRLEASKVAVRFEDDILGRVFRAPEATLTLAQTSERIVLAIETSIAGDEAKRVAIRLKADRPADGVSVAVEVDEFRPSVIGTAREDLAWMEDIDVPISGTARLSLDGDGKLLDLAGTALVGAGALAIDPERAPIGIEYAEARFHVDPARDRIALDFLEAETDIARFAATGHAYPDGGSLEAPERLVAQLSLHELVVPAEGTMEQPIVVSEGQVDLRASLDPLLIEIGQATLRRGPHVVTAKGAVWSEEEDWHVSLDAQTPRVSRDSFLAFWPISVKENIRSWLDANILAAEVVDAAVGVRWKSGEPVKFGTSFAFDDAEIRYLKTLPPITSAKGIGSFHGHSFVIAVESGAVTPPKGGAIKILPGSSFSVPDVRLKPGIAEVILKTESSVPAALSLLSQKPFNFLQNAGITPESAEGQARLLTRLTVPLKRQTGLGEVSFDVSGTARNVVTTKIVKNHTIKLPTVGVAVSNARLELSGPGTFDGISFDGVFEQALVDNSNAQARFEGRVDLGGREVEILKIGLPPGTVTGSGRGNLVLDLARGTAPRFQLTSNLGGIGMSIPALGWAKGRSSSGEFAIRGTLGTPANVERIALRAAGLSAEGTVNLNADGGLEAARFSNVSLGRWLNVAAVLRGRGKGRQPGVEVTSGIIDIRETSIGRGGGSSGGGQAGPPIKLALDRLQVSDGISMTDFRGEISSGGGLSGKFTGRVGGVAPVVGTLAPGRARGTAIRIRSDAGGTVLAAAGVLKNVRGGKLDLVLSPRRETGRYDGRLEIANARLVRASAMAELLNAISVVGLLDQLNGPGIQFSTVEAEFVLTPRQVLLTRSAAVGPSMGLSLDGTYDLASRQMDMQGVVSPIYALNGIGQIFTRRGEGLFGFNFRMTGVADDPRLSVNPLSILTPGMFREIFRRPPPSPSQ